MAELVDATDSKSVVLMDIPVRVRSGAPVLLLQHANIVNVYIPVDPKPDEPLVVLSRLSTLTKLD